jgi:hypothetical protein
VPLLKFPVTQVEGESASQFLVKVELDTERVIGTYSLREHEACVSAKLPNGGRLNHVSSKWVLHMLCA